MKCPTANCNNTLATHSRRKYCKACRASMGYYSRKRPAEILRAAERSERILSRIAHIPERKLDQLEAVSQLRRDKKSKKSKTRIHQQDARA